MELFSLMAKLTLDAKDFEKEVDHAKSIVSSIELEDPVLGLNDGEFVEKMASAQAEDVADLTDENAPKLGLDDTDFDTKMSDAQDEDVDDLTGDNAPKLGLDDEDFDTKMTDAQDESVDDMTGENAPKLGLENGEFNSNISESQTLGEGFAESMGTAFKTVKTVLATTGIVASIGGIVSKMKEMIDMTAQTADGIDKGSKRLDISTKAYQEWDHALRQSGAGISDLARGIRNIQKLSAAANNPYDAFEQSEDIVDGLTDETVGLGEEASKAFKRLGISAKVANGEISGTEEIMKETLLALASYRDDDRSLLVRALFGNNADGLNALLDEGKEGVEALLNEAGDLGFIMDEEEISNAVAYGDAVANLQEELQAIQSAFVGLIIPNLTDALTKVTEFLAALNPRNKENSLDEILTDIDDKAISAGNDLDTAGEKAKRFIERLSEMGDYWTLDEKDQKTWDQLAQDFIKAYPQFAYLIDQENHVIQGNTKEINDNIDAWVKREKQMLLDNAFVEKRAEVAKMAEKSILKGAEALEKEDDAYIKQGEAIEAVNDILKKNQDLRNAVYGAYGTTTLTDENAADVLSFIHEQGFETVGMEAVEEWYKLTEEVKSLKEESANLQTQADEAQASLEKNQKALEEYMTKSQTETDTTKKKVEDLTKALLAVPKSIPISFPLFGNLFGNSHAIGSNYIPYDNYPALLHRGEKVLTSTEARNQGQNIDFSDMESRIENAIREGMNGARVNAYIDGRAVTDEVNRNNMNDVKGRRFR